MRHYIPTARRPARRAAASVELALLLPFLMFAFIAAVDYSRLFYYSLIITNCARCGAVYGSQSTKYAAASNWPNIKAAALAEASSLSPAPTVDDPVLGTDANGNPTISVTVHFSFQTIGIYPSVSNPYTIVGFSDPLTLTRTVEMRVAPVNPSGS
jgi:Flp pilus assembly protein TadG